ncbi:MAG TPA: cation transporter [Baekduia sp.]|nr:cation transporter [Baekduia sp.]
MRYPGGTELPAELEAAHRRAVRLEWISIAYLVSAIVAIYFTLGSSQAMKGAWLEDMLSLAPPLAFLVAARVRYRPPSRRFAFGYHRAVEIAYLTAALALLFMGTFLIVDSTLKLLGGDHPSIGMVELFDWQVWLGWLMLAALTWSVVPAVVLGRLKIRLASELHDKVLFADAQMNKADWMTGAAAMAGVVGIGLGLWWADAAAAIAIGADILRDGVRYTTAAVRDLLDGRPRRYDEEGEHPLDERIEQVVAETPWVQRAAVRIRDTGHVFNVSVLAVPADEDGLVDRCEQLSRRLLELDWKVQEAVVAPVRRLDDAPSDVVVDGWPRHRPTPA